VSDLKAVEKARAEVGVYRRRLQRDPDSLLFAEFANHLRRAGLTSDAIAMCARGLMRHPGYATGHVVMGEIFRDAGLLEKAEREWQEALRLDPGHPRAHLCLGELYLSRGDDEQAAAAFRAALASNPDLPEAHAKLAELTGEDSTRVAAADPSPGKATEWELGKRPEWLTSARLDDLVARVGACGSIETAALTNSDGLLLAGDMPAGANPVPSAVALAEFTADLRNLLVRLGGGRLRAAVLANEAGSVHCMALGELTLAAAQMPGTPIEGARDEIEDAIRSAARASEDGSNHE